MGNARFVVVICISYFFSSRKSICTMGDLVHVCCLSLGRCRKPLYLVVMHLVKFYWECCSEMVAHEGRGGVFVYVSYNFDCL